MPSLSVLLVGHSGRVDGGGSWIRRHRVGVAVVGALVVVAGLVVFAVWSSPTGDRGAVIVAALAVLAPVLLWAADRRSKTAKVTSPSAADAPADTPADPTGAAGPPSGAPRLVVDPVGRIGGGDRAAAQAYVARIRKLPALERVVRTALTSPSVRVVEDAELERARTEFERVATEFARGGVVYPWGPPSVEDWTIALETLWSLAAKRPGAASGAWFAWAPGGAASPVRFSVPDDDELVHRLANRFKDRPLHIQSIDSRIVWRWLAPAAVRSAALAGPGSLPVVLDDWRVSATDPHHLASVEPGRSGGRVASSANRAWSW